MRTKEYHYYFLPATQKQAKDKSNALVLSCLKVSKALAAFTAARQDAGTNYTFAAAGHAAWRPDYWQASSSSWSYWIIEATWVFHRSADM